MSHSQDFSIWVVQLSGRVVHLHQSLSHKSPVELEKKANVCEAQLHQLYDFARQHQIDINQYFFQLTDIEYRLRFIEERLEWKKAHARSRVIDGWGKALTVVLAALEILSKVLGLNSLSPRLPGRAYPRLPSGQSAEH